MDSVVVVIIVSVRVPVTDSGDSAVSVVVAVSVLFRKRVETRVVVKVIVLQGGPGWQAVVVDVTVLADVAVTGCTYTTVAVDVGWTTFNPRLVVVEVSDDVSVVAEVKGNPSVVVVAVEVRRVDGGVAMTIFPKLVASPLKYIGPRQLFGKLPPLLAVSSK